MSMWALKKSNDSLQMNWMKYGKQSETFIIACTDSLVN